MADNSLNIKRTSSLKKSLSGKYTHIPGCQKDGAFHIRIEKNRASHKLFVGKRGPFGTHIRTMPYIGSKSPAPPPSPPPHTHTYTPSVGCVVVCVKCVTVNMFVSPLLFWMARDAVFLDWSFLDIIY